MKKKFGIIPFVVALMLILTSFCVSAAPHNLQFFFEPQIMHDVTGEITVYVNMRNFSVSVPDTYGGLCGLTFEFAYNTDKFDLVTDSNGNAKIFTDNTLIKNPDVINASANTDLGTVRVLFIDNSLNDNLVFKDGRLFAFKLMAKNVSALWNSTDYYPLRFTPSTLGVITYSNAANETHRYYDGELLDGIVGGYNTYPILNPPSRDKYMVINEYEQYLVQDGEIMITAGSFGEAVGMSYDTDVSNTHCIYNTYGSVKVNDNDMTLYINSVKKNTTVTPFPKGGTIYIPLSTIYYFYPNAEINIGDGSVEIYIP